MIKSCHQHHPQESRTTKAERLRQNHRVVLLNHGKAVVIGDHNTYDLIKLGQKWRCSCPWGRHNHDWSECSHVIALRRALLDPDSLAPVARLAELLNQAVDHLAQNALKRGA